MISTLMAKYHQPYSEIIKMPIKDAMFFIELAGAEHLKGEHEINKMKSKANKIGRGR